jgi:hypothetical protein
MALSKARRTPSRQEERMRVALEEFQMNEPVRQAAAGACPKSTLHYGAAQIANLAAHKAGGPTALTISEAKAVVDLIVQHADGAEALTTSVVIFPRMPEARRRCSRSEQGAV